MKIKVVFPPEAIEIVKDLMECEDYPEFGEAIELDNGAVLTNTTHLTNRFSEIDEIILAIILPAAGRIALQTIIEQCMKYIKEKIQTNKAKKDYNININEIKIIINSNEIKINDEEKIKQMVEKYEKKDKS